MLVDVEPVQRTPERALAVQRALHHGLEDRSESQRIPSRDEVERGPQQPHPHRGAFGDRPRQRLGTEAIQPRPQRDVGVSRHLRLHPDQPLDRLERPHPAPAEQHLPLEQRSVQGSAFEHARAGRCQVVCVPSLTQFARQGTPPSDGKGWEGRADPPDKAESLKAAPSLNIPVEERITMALTARAEPELEPRVMAPAK